MEPEKKKKTKLAFHLVKEYISTKITISIYLWTAEIVWYRTFYNTFTTAGSLIERIFKNTATHFIAQIKDGGTC